jgi:hypothetical protein
MIPPIQVDGLSQWLGNGSRTGSGLSNPFRVSAWTTVEQSVGDSQGGPKGGSGEHSRVFPMSDSGMRACVY